MKILIIGAGVIGSFNAARLTRAGVDVTLLARGSRLAELEAHGVRLEDFRSRLRTTTRVKLVDRVDPDDAYDLAVVIVRRNQLASVLPMLAQAHRIPSVLFLGNSATGPELLVDALGKDRVLTGMVNAGGERERDTGVVRYLWSKSMPLVFAELDGRRSSRTAAIRRPKLGSSGDAARRRGPGARSVSFAGFTCCVAWPAKSQMSAFPAQTSHAVPADGRSSRPRGP